MPKLTSDKNHLIQNKSFKVLKISYIYKGSPSNHQWDKIDAVENLRFGVESKRELLKRIRAHCLNRRSFYDNDNLNFY